MAQKYPLNQTFKHKTQTHTFEIHYTRIGNPSAPPLIFIHGTPWSSYVWQDLASSLSSRYNIYLYDHPGFGASPSPVRIKSSGKEEGREEEEKKEDIDGALTLRASATAALIEHWDFREKPNVVAHDNGGLVALRLLLQHDIEMESLCLMDIVALPPFETPFFHLVKSNLEVFQAIPPNLLEGFISAYIKNATFHPLPRSTLDALCAPWPESGRQGTERFLGEMVQASQRNVEGLMERYADVGKKVRTKILWGKEDKWLDVEIAGRLRQVLGVEEGSVTVVEEAGHLVMLDQPVKVGVELALWLDGK